ncbi:MAG: Jag N-terminal domain-containing protein [Clostridia bacterium]|nr:Jag N-terminal domain-containing protein [Clostridia bacterium]
MRKYEASAKTVEEAIEQGLQELGVGIGDVDVQVLEEGSKGLFGLFGSRLAKVSLTVKEDEENLLENLMSEAEKPAPKAKTPAQEGKKPEKAPEKTQEKAPEAAAPRAEAEKPEKKEEHRPAPVRRTAPKKAERKLEEAPAEAAAPEAGAEENPAAENEGLRALEKPEITVIPEDQLDPESPAGIAKAFLQEMTRLMGVNVTIEMGTDPEGNVYASMNGDTLGILIGRRGETLDALQYLTSLKVNRGREGYVRVTLDTENYRARREDTLIRLANRMANRATRTGRRVSLEPMNPYERRVIHFALQANDQVSTHSEGDEPNRHVVITVKK